MSKDIVPELLDKLKKTFDAKVSKSAKVKRLLNKLESKKATYLDADAFAVELGELLRDTFAEVIKPEDLPNERMYYNIADRMIRDRLGANYKSISLYDEATQNLLNQQAGIHLKAVVPKMDESRVHGFVEALSEDKPFDEVKRVLEEPIVTYCRSIVQDSLEENVKFHYKSGFRPMIKRQESGHCCPWCKEVAGTHYYPDIPDGVFRSHNHCRCTIDYRPRKGKQDKLTVQQGKKWTKAEEEDKIEKRKELSEKKQENHMYPKELAGVKRGNMMSFFDADGEKPNPNFKKDEIYRINCQTCVVAYEARRRGYNVEAKGNFEGSVSEMLSRDTRKAWIDPKTGVHPEFIGPDFYSPINTPAKYYKYLQEELEENTRYTMQFGWKGRGNGGHIVNIFKNDGDIVIYDPQTGKVHDDVKEYLGNVKFNTTLNKVKYTTAPKLLEVEKYEFDVDVVNEILTKSGDQG